MSKRARTVNKNELLEKGIYEVVDQPLIVFKKVCIGWNDFTIKCEIPVGSEIVVVLRNDQFQKMRTNELKVLAYSKDHYRNTKSWSKDSKKIFSSYHGRPIKGNHFPYRVGKTLKVRLNKDLNDCCKPGLHFFLHEDDARLY